MYNAPPTRAVLQQRLDLVLLRLDVLIQLPGWDGRRQAGRAEAAAAAGLLLQAPLHSLEAVVLAAPGREPVAGVQEVVEGPGEGGITVYN